ncbi:reverse transcriptase domain-containing protein [Tanacetum coccineum]|uniref:Reverse transcriptase domain-containing protein n=1 Tax=Tanacetum coccineum TaxID=301880 RepID=A0ABQ5A214_9ASTR
MDAMTIKMDAQYKELQSRAKKPKPDLDEDDMPMSPEEEAIFMQTFHNPNDQQNNSKTPINFDSDDEDEEPTPQPETKPLKPVKETPIDVIDEILEEDFDALLDEGSKILHSIEGTVLEEEIFFEFDKFISMAANENYDSESDEEEPKFEKITINTDYKIKTSLEEPPTDFELKPLPNNLEYVFLEEPSFLPVLEEWSRAKSEHVNVVFTRIGKSYDPPDNPNDQQNNSETPINFDRDDENDEHTPQPKTQPLKLVKETPLPKPYKPKIPYPQRLRKEKMEAQYRKFLDMIRAVRINVPLVDVLAGMPNYEKFLKELISNKHKIEQISIAFLSDESSALIQNKVPPKIRDPGSFLIPCNFNKTFSCNALADLGASINLIPYSLYAKLSLENLKPTKMCVRLADRSFQYPFGIAENMLVEVGKFTFPADFVILEMEEDSKVPLILGRPFLHTADAVIRVKQKQLNLGVGTERMIFNINSAIKHSIPLKEPFSRKKSFLNSINS